MQKRTTGRWLSEFLIIVMGVLVALAVNDWVQYRSDRELERHLLERLEDDLVADAGDLALAQLQLLRRQWLFAALVDQLEAQGDGPLSPPEDLVRADWAVPLIVAAERDEVRLANNWDPLGDPLATLEGRPEFDLSDDSFREMLAAGALRTMQGPDIRTAILAYYRTARDMGENVKTSDNYWNDLLGLLLDEGVAVGDRMSFGQFKSLVDRNPRLAAQLRHGLSLIRYQILFLAEIENARLTLESELQKQ